MRAEIAYNIRKVGDDWMLIRGANCSIVKSEADRAAPPLPDVIVATFSDEVEANLFAFWLDELRGKVKF